MWINNKFKIDDVVTHVLEPDRRGVVEVIAIARKGEISYTVMWGRGHATVEDERHLTIVATLNRDGIRDIDDYPYGT